MENILVQFILPILTAIISYMAAVNKSKKELDAVKEENRGRIEQIEAQSRADIEKLEKELDKKFEVFKLLFLSIKIWYDKRKE